VIGAREDLAALKQGISRDFRNTPVKLTTEDTEAHRGNGFVALAVP
jgi:hypothetical protein